MVTTIVLKNIFSFVFRQILRIPVPITELEIWIFWVSVTWIPSVLGLSPGAVTVRPEA